MKQESQVLRKYTKIRHEQINENKAFYHSVLSNGLMFLLHSFNTFKNYKMFLL